MIRFKAAYVSGPAAAGAGHRAAATPVAAGDRAVPAPATSRPRRATAPPTRPTGRAATGAGRQPARRRGRPARRARRRRRTRSGCRRWTSRPRWTSCSRRWPITQRYGCTAEDEEWRGRLRAVTGIVDRPFEQRRDPLWVDLSAAAGHVAVVGAPQSGKSTMLRTLICSLALTAHPGEVQFYCLDFGGGSLAGAGRAAARRRGRHPAGRRPGPAHGRRGAARCWPGARRSSPDRASSRSPRTGGCGASGEIAGDGFGDVFLVVDGWLTLRQDFEELEPAITADRGPGPGLRRARAGRRPASGRSSGPAIRDLFGTRLELRLGDPYESEIDRRLAGERARGLARAAASPATACTSWPRCRASTPSPRADDLADGRARSWPRRSRRPGRASRAPRVRLLPDVLPVRAAARRRADRHAGSRSASTRSTLSPVLLDFGADPHFLVFGDTECGKSNLLRLIAESIVDAVHARPGPADLHRLPRGRCWTRGRPSTGSATPRPRPPRRTLISDVARGAARSGCRRPT